MATLGNYYLNGPSLSTATKVFTDVALTICAPDGYYSDGTISRQQVSCLLLPQQTCSDCVAGCSDSINATASGVGLYKLTFSTGGALGALRIYFQPFGKPDGIRVTYNSINYNKLTSTVYGSLKSNNTSNYTFVGNNTNDCSIGTTLDGGGYTNQNVFIYNIGTSSFPATPDQTDGVVTGTSGDVNLTANDPGYCTLVIPVNDSAVTDVSVEIFGVCPPNTSWNLLLNCPAPLVGVPSSNVGEGCAIFPNTYYSVPNAAGTAGEPVVNEFFVLDENGLTLAPAGDYGINPPSGSKIITVDANGVITQINTCP